LTLLAGTGCRIQEIMYSSDVFCVGCLKMSNRQAIKRGRDPSSRREESTPASQGAWDRHLRLSIKAHWPKARVSTSRRIGPEIASQHQGALARRPRLSIKARWLDARVSASRRVGSTPASQHQGALARHLRLSIKARWLDARVSAPRRVG